MGEGVSFAGRESAWGVEELGGEFVAFTVLREALGEDGADFTVLRKASGEDGVVPNSLRDTSGEDCATPTALRETSGSTKTSPLDGEDCARSCFASISRWSLSRQIMQRW